MERRIVNVAELQDFYYFCQSFENKLLIKLYL